MTLNQFITIVYNLVIHNRWGDLREFFSLVREILSRPTAVITAGQPQDKELE
jgi:hypothetical protein